MANPREFWIVWICLAVLYFVIEGIIKEQIGSQSKEGIRRMLELFIDVENKIKYAVIPQLPLELAIVKATLRET